ncbi:SGNH hydrolase [Aulographum hederae CBS 113979]|uniref:SGNH hydrolase n=1 Tax=Aulographum hederae CBS 113979 TaxID=1176131 RepID=A0A6G1GJD6_9PEZI|nr:SGNH hydrolase [Aulographum hederae CBS 113979]
MSNNPKRRPREWVALGDSFAAGPGAGDAWGDRPECVRGERTYPLQMQNNRDMPGPARGQKPAFTMKACTGDVTTNLTDQNNPNYQLGAIKDTTDFVTLSIGGNDVKFSTILKACVYGIAGDCDQAIAGGRGNLYDGVMHTNYFNVINEILDRMRWQDRREFYQRTSIYQTGYSQFFDSFTDQCDTTSFFPYDGLNIAPLMKKELRRKLNHLAHEVNYVLNYWIAILNVDNSHGTTLNKPFTSALNYADVDTAYTNNRFCRDGVTEPDRSNADTWFFHLLGSQGESVDSNQGGKNSTYDGVKAEMQAYDNPDINPEVEPRWVIKTFHPTSAGMDLTATFMVNFKLKYREAVQATLGTTFDVMVLGDNVPYASQDPTSPIYQGFMRHLRSIFGSSRFYGFPPDAYPGLAKIEYLGSQQPDYLGAAPHECYPGATIDQLHQNFRDSPDSNLQNKLVILQAGTTDLLFDIDVRHAAQRVYRLIRTIFKRDKNAVVLLAHIPMIGIGGDGSTWYNLQRRVVEYNAHLSAVADMLMRQGFKVMKVHSSATPREHMDGDFLLPNAMGYERMAYDMAEAMVLVNAIGWLPPNTDSQAAEPDDQDSLKKAAAAGSIQQSGAANEVPKVVCTEDRSQSVGQGAPNSKGILDAIFRGKTKEKFVNDVACKKKEICKMSTNGLHGDPAAPEMLLLNATECVYAGGSSAGSDFNQLVVRLPTFDYDLDNAQECKDAVSDILKTCFEESEDWYGGSWKGSDGLSIEFSNLNYPRSSVLDHMGIIPMEADAVKAAVEQDRPMTTQLPLVANDLGDYPESEWV